MPRGSGVAMGLDTCFSQSHDDYTTKSSGLLVKNFTR